MSYEPEVDYKAERIADVSAVVDSKQSKKVVVAGPGTGKSYLFEQVIKQKQSEGKSDFLAITFIGKLGDSLADDLAGLAETHTLHGFARSFFLSNNTADWVYCPYITKIITEDLKLSGIDSFSIGDDNYKARTIHYKAVGHDDIVHYAVQICKKHPEKITVHDLILIDEFQDFNEIEAEFIDILATKNEVLIVGDDDQALYEFKGSSPKFIRDKFHEDNQDFESHTLRFCSRCPEVVINAFHGIATGYGLNEDGIERIKKDYICYLPDKEKDSRANPKICILEGVPTGMIAFKIRSQLESILETQKIKSVLIIGEGQSCGAILYAIAKKLRSEGFKNVDHSHTQMKPFEIEQSIVDSYHWLVKNTKSTLGWRILCAVRNEFDWQTLLKDNFTDADKFIESIPANFRSEHEANAKVLQKITHDSPSKIKAIADSSIEKVMGVVVKSKKTERELLINQLVLDNANLARPLSNLDITVCSILGSKGLGADVVFLVGFDEGKLPSKKQAQDSEVYQMLVALTRTKKRIYLINTVGAKISSFAGSIDKSLIQKIS